jgi:hypothetical protein
LACGVFSWPCRIGDEIYESADPISDVTPSSDRDGLLREVIREVEDAAGNREGDLR